ncbi:hypothetical protein MASS_1038 [Mycobacteroides abscessus subsp. bolletii 50594]|uniref:Uncharacterized protein n=1 Tax=Mycobacteroides abscessus subsp. bolletii 50594 TaxID=1303024 RepID=A0AB33A717_9MYCO|nr:hypothetical protein MASS_1038 [Mycobacteroides abscessus subsp. bolletii 50594]
MAGAIREVRSMFRLDNAVLAFRFTATVIGGRALPWPVCRYQPGQQAT